MSEHVSKYYGPYTIETNGESYRLKWANGEYMKMSETGEIAIFGSANAAHDMANIKPHPSEDWRPSTG